MALKLHTLITAILMSLIVAVTLLPANAAAQAEPERQQVTASDSDLFKVIVQRYRELVAAIGRALSNDTELRETVADARLNEAIGKALREQPNSLKPPAVAAPDAGAPRTYVPPVYTPPAYTPPAYTPPSSTPQSSIGSARLTWNIPTRRENGERLQINEIASYEIYMTAESTGASRTIRVSDPSKTQFTLVPLAADTYHFSMATIDSEGTYSGLSQVVSKTVR